jgi:hypothetical protein
MPATLGGGVFPKFFCFSTSARGPTYVPALQAGQTMGWVADWTRRKGSRQLLEESVVVDKVGPVYRMLLFVNQFLSVVRQKKTN